MPSGCCEYLVRYVCIGADVAMGRENMARYLIRASFSSDTAPARDARASWARFIKKVIAADPLVLADCGGPIRIIGFIEEQRIVHAILVHLSLWNEPRPPLGSAKRSAT